MAKTRRPKTLPATLILRLINRDLDHAVCGSPTRCALAQCIFRTFDDPEPTIVRVKENRVTITWCGMLHHYALTDHALRLVAKNDDGSLSLSPTESHTIRLPLIRVRSAHINLSDERKKQIADSNAARAAVGRKYPRRKNTRMRAAELAGVRNKKLAALAAAAAAKKAHTTGTTARVAR